MNDNLVGWGYKLYVIGAMYIEFKMCEYALCSFLKDIKFV